MKTRIVILCFAVIVIATGSRIYGQNYLYATGNPRFSTQIPIPNGFINVNNGEIHLEIPLSTLQQRGHLQLNEELVYDSRIWQDANFSWQPTNVPNSMGGWRFTTNTQSPAPTYSENPTQWGSCGPGQEQYPTDETINNFAWTDPQGTPHAFNISFSQYLPIPCDQNVQANGASGYALDGSGYFLNATYDLSWGGVDFVVYDASGNQIYPTAQDPNGNYFSSDSNGNLIDTLGRTPVKTTFNGNQIIYNVLGWQGNYYTYTVTTETIYYHTAFSTWQNSSGSFTAIRSIQLPDGSSYQFNYDSGTASGNYGELTSMTLPSGGQLIFSWQTFQDSFLNDNRWIAGYGSSGGTTTFAPIVATYCSSGYGCNERTDVTDPAGNDTVYTFYLEPGNVANAGSWVSSVYAYQGSQQGTIIEYGITNFTWNAVTDGSATYNIPAAQTATVTYTDGQTAKTITTLNSTGALPTSIQSWDYYYPSAPSNPTVQTNYTYGYSVNGASLPTAIQVTDGSGDLISETTYNYDETAATQVSGIPNHANVTGVGNLTSAHQWVNNTGSVSVTTTATYDNAGTMLTKTDPNGTTTFGHDGTDTFVTSVTLPTPSSNISLTSTSTYDLSSGLLENTIDPNTQETVYKNYDYYGRVGEIDYPDSGKTVYTYSPSHAYIPSQMSVYQYQNASTYVDTETLYDGYGRTIRSAIANGQGSNPWYEQDTCYNSLGQINFQSYRYQAASLNVAEVCSGAGDAISYDALGRVTKMAHGDGTQIVVSYYGRAKETTNENNVSRIVQTDAFGRTSAVCEVSSVTLQGGSGAPVNCATDLGGTGYLTSYAYNYTAGIHQTTVTQGAQSRVFQTDLIGRPTLQQEPESGTTTYSYAYNPNPGTTGLGLWVKRQRPQANQSNPSVLTSTYTQYDTLGRPVNINYDDGITSSKTFAYDASAGWGVTQQNLKGRLSNASGTATGTIYGYDPAGRTSLVAECTPSNCGTGAFILNYSYDWVGNALTSSDGFFTDTYTYSLANETQSIFSSLINSTHPQKLISNVQNGPFGPLSWQLGNDRNGVRQYDSMGRVSGGWVCGGSMLAGCSGGTQLYGFTSGWSGASLASSCDTSLNQCGSYTYDPLGRMSAMSITSGTPGSYTYAFDRWGNRVGQTEVSGSGGPQPSYSFNSYNQITNSGIVYDAAGNQTFDGLHHYTYDAEGNITAVDSGSMASYVYNALNQRVRVNTSAAAQEFIFNAAGQRVSSWDPVNKWEDSGQTYWGSTPVEFYADGYAQFQHQDWEGTLRATTDYTGAVQGTYASLPFGDFYSTTGVDDDVNHFAMLDFDAGDTDHAQYRQYSPTSGRWMSPDPYHGSYDFSNPQSLNRYAYVNGQPLASTDPSGLDPGDGCVWDCPIGGDFGCGFLCGLKNVFFPSGNPPSPQRIDVPRPAANPWNDKFGVPYPGLTASIQQAIGFPTAGCEFGACGAGPMSWQQAGGQPSDLDPMDYMDYPVDWWGLAKQVWTSLHIPYADPADSNHRLYGTHYCGPSGGGDTTSDLDILCAAHDACYNSARVSASSNLNPFTAGTAMGSCDMLLCAELRNLNPKSTQEAKGRAQIYQVFQCDSLGTGANPQDLPM